MVVLARHICGFLGVFFSLLFSLSLSLCGSRGGCASAISSSFVIPDRAPKHRSRLDAVSGSRDHDQTLVSMWARTQLALLVFPLSFFFHLLFFLDARSIRISFFFRKEK
nr:hypothetical protein [Pandoravirus aubagnensis]